MQAMQAASKEAAQPEPAPQPLPHGPALPTCVIQVMTSIQPVADLSLEKLVNATIISIIMAVPANGRARRST